MQETQKTGFRRYMALTFLIGFGFLTMGLMDPLYNTYVPFFFGKYLNSKSLIGAFMTLDNILQLSLITFVAVWSDRTRTRIGRRMPFIIVMLPVSAVLFGLIPPFAAVSFAALVAIIFVFNLFKTSVRGPVVALMPDTIPADYRSEANGVINMMGGIGFIISTLVLARLINIPAGLPAGVLSFAVAGVCVIIAAFVLFTFVREKQHGEVSASERIPLLDSIKQVFSGDTKSGAGRILVSLFFWFLGYEGILPFLGLFLVESLGVASSSAALAQGAAGVAGVILAVPSGYFAHRLGRRRYIRICLSAIILILAAIPLTAALTSGLALGPRLALFLGLMFLYGFFWIGIIVNSFPMLWQMSAFGNVGVYTGLYYTFSQGAAILAPPITGAVIDLCGYGGLFVFGALAMLIAWIVMAGVRGGEAAAKPGA